MITNDSYIGITKLEDLTGVPVREIGIILEEYGLRDSETKEPTWYALIESYATKIDHNQILWNKTKVTLLLIQACKPLSGLQHWVRHVKAIKFYLMTQEQCPAMCSWEEYKLACIKNSMFDEVPEEFREQVRVITKTYKPKPESEATAVLALHPTTEDLKPVDRIITIENPEPRPWP